MEYEILVWSGDTGDDVLFLDGGKRIDKASRIFKEATKKFPHRDIELRKYHNEWETGAFTVLKRYDKLPCNTVQLLTEKS